jgi:hypothetical protein
MFELGFLPAWSDAIVQEKEGGELVVNVTVLLTVTRAFFEAVLPFLFSVCCVSSDKSVA